MWRFILIQGEDSGPEVIEFLKLEVGNQYAEKVCDELSSVLNLSNRGKQEVLLFLVRI